MPVAVRLPRTVAARRALLTMVFLGGFLALAWVFGGIAHADSPSTRESVQPAAQPLESAADAVRQDSRERADEPRRARQGQSPERLDVVADTAHAMESAADREPLDSSTVDEALETAAIHEAVESAANREPVDPATAREAIESATKPLARTVERDDRPIGSLIETVADRSDAASSLVCRPFDGSDSGRTDDQDGDSADDRPGQPKRTSGTAAISRHGSRSSATLQPHTGLPSGGEQRWHKAGKSHSGETPSAPLPQAPTTPASHSAGDGGGPRGGDQQHAALFPGVTHLGLLPGEVHEADSTPTCERYRDILEFPG